MREYHHLYCQVRPNPFGYYWEVSPLPDWIHLTIEEIKGSKVLKVISRIHVDTCKQVGPSYSTDFSDQDIIKDLSGEISGRYL